MTGNELQLLENLILNASLGEGFFEIAVESEKARKKFVNEINDKVKSRNDIWPHINFANNRPQT